MTFAEYAALDGLNWSRLKHMRDTPLAYLRALESDDTDTADRALLRYQHALALEPHTIDRDFAVWIGAHDDKGKWQAAANSNAFKAFSADAKAKGQSVVMASTKAQIRDFKRAHDIGAAIRAHPVVAEVLPTAQAEVMFRGHDEAMGRIIKCRTDLYHSTMVLDIKDYGSTEARHCGRMAWRMGAVHQLAHNRRCMRAENVPVPTRFGLVCLDTKLTDVAIRWIDPGDLDRADAEILEMAALLAECEAADHWPGHGDGPLDLPSYAFAPDVDDFTFAEDLT